MLPPSEGGWKGIVPPVEKGGNGFKREMGTLTAKRLRVFTPPLLNGSFPKGGVKPSFPPPHLPDAQTW